MILYLSSLKEGSKRREIFVKLSLVFACVLNVRRNYVVMAFNCSTCENRRLYNDPFWFLCNASANKKIPIPFSITRLIQVKLIVSFFFVVIHNLTWCNSNYAGSIVTKVIQTSITCYRERAALRVYTAVSLTFLPLLSSKYSLVSYSTAFHVLSCGTSFSRYSLALSSSKALSSPYLCLCLAISASA